MKNKKEQPTQQEQSLVINIDLTRGLLILLALVLVTAACLGTLAWGQKEASAAQTSAAAFAGTRKYYLTTSVTRRGNQTLTACASGYHMASLWEILDPSNLEYNSDLGFVNTDRGEGPPTFRYGWVRTGWNSSTVSGNPGQDNCAAWTTDDSGANGTNASLPNDWTGGLEDLHVWDVRHEPCNYQRPVWCVED